MRLRLRDMIKNTSFRFSNSVGFSELEKAPLYNDFFFHNCHNYDPLVRHIKDKKAELHKFITFIKNRI